MVDVPPWLVSYHGNFDFGGCGRQVYAFMDCCCTIHAPWIVALLI